MDEKWWTDAGRHVMTSYLMVKAPARRHPAASRASEAAAQRSFSSILFTKYTNIPHALSHLPYSPAHLPHRLKHDQRLLPGEPCKQHRAHHLRHSSARNNLPIYAQHPLLGCAFWIFKQHGGQDKLPRAEGRGRVAGATIAGYVYAPHPR